jgi:hypothetical protein
MFGRLRTAINLWMITKPTSSSPLCLSRPLNYGREAMTAVLKHLDIMMGVVFPCLGNCSPASPGWA